MVIYMALDKELFSTIYIERSSLTGVEIFVLSAGICIRWSVIKMVFLLFANTKV